MESNQKIAYLLNKVEGYFVKHDAPPQCPFRFLRFFCPEHLIEEIEGDLLQKYRADVRQSGIRRARILLIWNSVRFLRPGILFRNRLSIGMNPIDMLLNQIKFAFRIFLRDRFFSSLNVAGLALGIAVCILLMLILQNDLRYDLHYDKQARIYRVGCHLQQVGLDLRWARSAPELAAILKDEYPEIEAAITINNNYGRIPVTYDGAGTARKVYYEDRVMDTDSGYFNVFSHTFIAGDPNTCLRSSHDVVITRNVASRYFDGADPIGKILAIDGEQWIVTAVIEDHPENTHLKFDFALSNQRFLPDTRAIESENLWNPYLYLYILVPDQYDTSGFYARFPFLFDRYFKPFGTSVGGRYEPILEPLADIHFESDLDFDESKGSKVYLYGFTITGALIMLLACINYMNLSTAKAINRAGEIAVKKVIGSRRRTLALSFLVESLLMSMMALSVAVALVYVVLTATPFNSLTGKNIQMNFFETPHLLPGALAIAVAIGIFSGLYPAFYLPSIPALKALKGSFRNSASGQLMRRALVTAQFAISILVVICSLLMRDQINYIMSRDLGFNRDNIVLLNIQDTSVQKNIAAIKNEFLRDRNILSATVSFGVPGMNIGGTQNMWIEGKDGLRQQGATLMFVGDDYLKTMGMTLVKGRDFQPGPTADVENAYIINEAAARLFGNDPLGKNIKAFHGEVPGQVIGVVKDFNFQSLHNRVVPLLMLKAQSPGGYLHLKVTRDQLPQTMENIRKIWTRYNPAHPFEYAFLDHRVEEQYREDAAQNTLLSVLSFICVFVSLLGLVGLSAFNATQRTKEIGVRKVLGASVRSIIILLSRQVIVLVILASVIAIPVSGWIVMQWMERFAYQAQPDAMVYFVVVAAATGIVFITILFQSLKTARANPVESLKCE